MTHILDKVAYAQGFHAAVNGLPMDTFTSTKNFWDSYVLGFHDGKLKRRRYANG